MDTDILFRSIPSKSSFISSIVSIATPAIPTSPLTLSLSEPYPLCVGKSKATERPV